ncbi:DUF3866 family protein [Crassaminicella profunda]|uniref:DUF3866 family protein n=1 Tax=Crassaminicella profunda TaxID=1286698 RepID=UPI001CA613C2|nr:DUF3866 family protein [Crassaminicella profunda]QZY56821.1 DUF3866 family protein [Crassaminicella profunda]
MIGIKVGKVIEILNRDNNKTEVLVKINDIDYKAVNYNRLTGNVDIGNTLLLNTTAVDLNLGTGGYHFVLSNLDNSDKDLSEGGHIMKLRYTPYQLKVFAAEEQESKYHEVFKNFKSLEGMPVIVGTLHSMLPPMIEMIKSMNQNIKIAYIMTDGAALPIDFSNIVKKLKEEELINGTVTIGNAFGGDLDCINIYNGLIAAKEILKCDIAIVTMGPGIAGTGTQYGFSGIEQGYMIDAVNDLGGEAIAALRISFADKRKRHQGISHHTITVLDKISKTKAMLPIPKFEESKKDYISSQLKNTMIEKKHKIIYMNPGNAIDVLKNSTFNMRTMGRNLLQDQEYFITAAMAGKLGVMVLNDHQLKTVE